MRTDSDWFFSEIGRCEEYADRFGTPYFVYDADTIARRVASVRDAFRNRTSVYFAVKANPNLKLLESIRECVDGLDISSVGELKQALLAGYDPERLSFAGPAKTLDELERAVSCGIGSISIESERELRDVARVASAVGRKANLLLRVNPQTDPRAFGLKMGGKPVQFGIDEELLDAAVGSIAEHPDELNLRGVHIYAGSQGFDHEPMAASYRHSLAIAERVESLIGSPLEKINLGGGFGVAHGASAKSLDLEALAASVGDDFERHITARSAATELIFELGRFLVADAGVYVTRVISLKESRGHLFAITDGGLHHHLAAAGSFGVGFRTNYPIVNVSNPDGTVIECSIAGPSCNPTDLLGQKTEVSEVREGDLLAVLSSGSYGLTASPILFLGRRTPAEIVRHRGESMLGRRRRDIVDFN